MSGQEFGNRQGHRQISLAGAGRTDPESYIGTADRFHILQLMGCARNYVTLARTYGDPFAEIFLQFGFSFGLIRGQDLIEILLFQPQRRHSGTDLIQLFQKR